MTLLATIVVIGVLIFVHELGHFMAAKAVGIRVERFSLGLGPVVAGFRRGETEYVLSAIPLGGYVKMSGMNDEVMERLEGGETDRGRSDRPGRPEEGAARAGAAGRAGAEAEDTAAGAGEAEGRPRELSDRDFDSKPIWARALVISAGVIMNFVFAFVAYAAVAGVWGVRLPDTDRVGQVVARQLPPGAEALAEFESGARLVRIDGRPIADWRDVRAALREGEPGPATVELADAPAVEIRIPGSEADRRRLYSALVPWTPAVVGAVNPGSPADRAGLEAGDRIVAVEGRPIEGWSELLEGVQERPGERIELTVERDGRELVRAVVPDAVRQTDPATGERREVGQVGIYQGGGGTVTLRQEPLEAVRTGAMETVAFTWLVVDFLGDLLTGDISPRAVGSVFTIGEASGQAARAGADAFLQFMAFFSINLAILNLLPIPVLDGGHLVFLAIEAVRRRPVSVEQRMRWSQIGFLIVVALMVWALSADVLRLLGL